MEKILFRTALFMVIASSMFLGVCFAGPLTQVLAPDYYNEGLNFERMGDLFEAKAAYQKALLLDPGIPYKKEIVAKIEEINSEEGKRVVTATSQSSDTYVAYVGPSNTNNVPAVQEDKESEYAAYMDSYNRLVSEPPSNKIVTEPSGKPQVLAKKVKPREFVSYFTGQEPFLQDCQTPLCEKLIFNNFGISYGRERNFFKAEGMFKECLQIDSFFKPARINLEILKEMQQQ